MWGTTVEGIEEVPILNTPVIATEQPGRQQRIGLPYLCSAAAGGSQRSKRRSTLRARSYENADDLTESARYLAPVTPLTLCEQPALNG